MKILAFLTLVMTPFFSLQASLAETCVPNVDSCGFYVCEEKKHQCGPKGYPLGFGFKFCGIFLNTEHTYSPEAHAWLRRVRVCLMESFQQENEGIKRTCGEIKKAGFRSHLNCYVNTGFCELRKKDQVRISWAMKTSFIHSEVIRDAVSVAYACAVRTEQNPVVPVEPK